MRTWWPTSAFSARVTVYILLLKTGFWSLTLSSVTVTWADDDNGGIPASCATTVMLNSTADS